MSRIAILSFLALILGVGSAQAHVVIKVDKSTQTLSVDVNGQERYEWPVSTARSGYTTPNGTYHPQRMAKKWYSHQYDMSPMPHSIFFKGGYAIHGSYETSHIGRPASHGCVRLSPKHAAKLYSLVKNNRDDTKIVVTGQRPSHTHVARAHRHHRYSQRREYAREHHDYGFGRSEYRDAFDWAPPWQDGSHDRGGRWWQGGGWRD